MSIQDIDAKKIVGELIGQLGFARSTWAASTKAGWCSSPCAPADDLEPGVNGRPLYVRVHMLNRYPEQASSRKGFALIGGIFFIFGLLMVAIEQVVMAVFGVLFGVAFFVPAVFFGYAGFAKTEKIFSTIFAGW